MKTGLFAFIVVLLLLSNAACSILGVGIQPAREPTIRPDAPILARPSAQALVGRNIDEVLVSANQTTAKQQLDSQLIRQVAEKAMPAVVSIYTETATSYRVSLFPIPLPGTTFRVALPGKALGSAFFIHPSGFLLSNNHVIQNARSIKAMTSDGTDYDLIVVARDPAMDLALLQVVEPGGRFPYIPVGDSDEVGVGDWVIAIGNPLGLGHTVTQGIISQTGREITKRKQLKGRHIEFLQTDTAINPGSSGGPLITLTGAVIGVNTAIIAGAQGIAFTVPSVQVREFIRHVLAGQGEAEQDPR